MKQFLLCCAAATFLVSCNSSDTGKSTASGDSTSTTTATATPKPTVDLPYTASYSSSFTADVSDADLKTVLMGYKDWADGNMTNVAKSVGDSLEWYRADGAHFKLSNAGIMKLWGTYRDSLSSVAIDMEAWQKMYSTDKKDSIISAWYKETDTYKGGKKVDSAYYNDINLMKGGKIVYLESYRRPAK